MTRLRFAVGCALAITVLAMRSPGQPSAPQRAEVPQKAEAPPKGQSRRLDKTDPRAQSTTHDTKHSSAGRLAELLGRRIIGSPFATRSPAVGREAMAATSHGIATETALRILRAGGNAVDAAIAANAVLCVGEPTGCGVGGDLFAIVWDAKSGKLHGLNASGRSPLGLTRDVLIAAIRTQTGVEQPKSIPARGPLPVSVPGCVDGWFELHGKFGELKMSDVLAPAIDYADNGIPIPAIIAEYWRRNAATLRNQPFFAKTFLPAGTPPAAGELFRNPDLAATLRAIADRGRDAFYRGTIAKRIANHTQSRGGFLTEVDLARHRSEWIEPISTSYRDRYRVFELPPNGQGLAALQMLNILEGYDLRTLGFGHPDAVHLLVEAKKLAFEDRARLYGDPAFGKLPINELLTKEYAAKRRSLIDPAQSTRSYPTGNPAIEDGDTIFLTTADREGNMVSLIQSNYRGMGSGVTPPGLGFILQNRGELFDLEPGRANSYAPGKRPFHTIIPAFITRDDKPWISFGVMGGAMQPQGHAQIVVNLIDYDMDLQTAGDAPRVRHEGSSQPTGEAMTDGGRVFLEPGFDPRVADVLRARGHQVTVRADSGFGGYQAIQKLAKSYFGASESRKDGHAAGF